MTEEPHRDRHGRAHRPGPACPPAPRHDPAAALVGLAERVKRAAGPAIGLTRAAFPAASILTDRWRKVYGMAKELQDDYARLRAGRG